MLRHAPPCHPANSTHVTGVDHNPPSAGQSAAAHRDIAAIVSRRHSRTNCLTYHLIMHALPPNGDLPPVCDSASIIPHIVLNLMTGDWACCMDDDKEFWAENSLIAAGAVNGVICALALLIDTLESNGALKPHQFEGVLAETLALPDAPVANADMAVLRHLAELLHTKAPFPLAAANGGRETN